MNNQLKKVLVFALILLSAFTVYSCENLTTNVTTIESTTTTVISEETTTITSSDLTTEATTQITTLETTTILTTTEMTTLETTTIETTTTYVDNSRIVIVSPSKTTYTVFDEINLTGLVVTFYDEFDNQTVLTEADYQVQSIDMDTYGVKEIFIEYGNYTASFTIQVNLQADYLEAMDLTGLNLFNKLHQIVNLNFDGVSYGDARYILDETDRDPNNSSKVIQVYTGLSVSAEWSCATAATCNWNREHVWPQSDMPVSASNSTTNMASDLHNLKPADYYENSSRGDSWFGPGGYIPRDEVKGDIARILFYMVIMYDELTLNDGYSSGSYTMGYFSTLLQWNELDPVDDFEMNRNNVIESYQGNRNPFIDYPEFVNLIWN